MKKLIISAVVVLGMLLVAQQLVMPKLASKMFAKAAGETLGVDQTADLADGLHVYICGAGSPLPDPKRSGSCIGVLAGETAFVIDVGSGSIRNLAMMGFPMSKIEQFYLTHTHSDHFDGLGEAMLLTWISANRSAPIPITGPAGTTAVVNGFNAAYAGDAKFRTAHHGPAIANPDGFGGIGEDINLTQGTQVIYDNGPLKITASTVFHEPASPAFGYRIDYKNRSIYITGDTAYDTKTAAYAKDVDVLFHEALNKQMVSVMERAARANSADNLATILEDITDYHASPYEAAQTATDANAQNLVIYHLVPPLPVDSLKTLFARDMNKAFEGKITISEDGTIVRLPSGTEAIIYENGL